MDSVKFEEYKQRITEALRSKGNLGITEPVTLLDGFISQPFNKELSGTFTIGGPTIPMVILVGNNTGRIYYFALRALLPDLKL